MVTLQTYVEKDILETGQLAYFLVDLLERVVRLESELDLNRVESGRGVGNQTIK